MARRVRVINYHKAQFIRRGYWDSGMLTIELAENYNVHPSTIYGIVNNKAHTSPAPADLSEEICLACHLPVCVYDVQEWPNAEMLKECGLKNR